MKGQYLEVKEETTEVRENQFPGISQAILFSLSFTDRQHIHIGFSSKY